MSDLASTKTPVHVEDFVGEDGVTTRSWYWIDEHGEDHLSVHRLDGRAPKRHFNLVKVEAAGVWEDEPRA